MIFQGQLVPLLVQPGYHQTPKRLRGSSTVALTLGLHEVLSDINNSDGNINFEIEISYTTFNEFNIPISGWRNLLNKPSDEFLNKVRDNSNISNGGTAFSPTFDYAFQEFQNTTLVDSCKILVFMTDGVPMDIDPLSDIDSKVQTLKIMEFF